MGSAITDGDQLRFYDPVGQRWLPTPTEVLEQKDAVIELASLGWLP